MKPEKLERIAHLKAIILKLENENKLLREIVKDMKGKKRMLMFIVNKCTEQELIEILQPDKED